MRNISVLEERFYRKIIREKIIMHIFHHLLRNMVFTNHISNVSAILIRVCRIKQYLVKQKYKCFFMITTNN